MGIRVDQTFGDCQGCGRHRHVFIIAAGDSTQKLCERCIFEVRAALHVAGMPDPEVRVEAGGVFNLYQARTAGL